MRHTASMSWVISPLCISISLNKLFHWFQTDFRRHDAHITSLLTRKSPNVFFMNSAIIGSNNGLSRVWPEAIIYSSANYLLAWSRSNFSKIWTQFYNFQWRKCTWNVCQNTYFVQDSVFYAGMDRGRGSVTFLYLWLLSTIQIHILYRVTCQGFGLYEWDICPLTVAMNRSGFFFKRIDA